MGALVGRVWRVRTNSVGGTFLWDFKYPCEEGGEVARGYDSRGVVAGEHQQAALVAGHEVIWLAGFGENQQKIVAPFGGEYQVRPPVDVLGELSNLTDQPTCLIGFDEIGDSRVLQRGTQLVKVLRAGQESEFAPS